MTAEEKLKLLEDKILIMKYAVDNQMPGDMYFELLRTYEMITKWKADGN